MDYPIPDPDYGCSSAASASQILEAPQKLNI